MIKEIWRPDPKAESGRFLLCVCCLSEREVHQVDTQSLLRNNKYGPQTHSCGAQNIFMLVWKQIDTTSKTQLGVATSAGLQCKELAVVKNWWRLAECVAALDPLLVLHLLLQHSSVLMSTSGLHTTGPPHRRRQDALQFRSLPISGLEPQPRTTQNHSVTT